MMCWLCQLIYWWGVGISTSDLTQRSGLITHITSDLVSAPKILLYCMEYYNMLTSSSAFSKRPIFFVPDHPIGRTCRIGTSELILGPRNFRFLQIFKPSFKWLGSYKFRQSLQNIKTLLNKLPASIWLWADNILSFFSVEGQSNRTRAVWTILLHQTCSLSTKNELRGRNQIRLDPVQLFCNSFCVQHKMVGDDHPFILQCLVYRKKGTVHHWGILTRP